MNTCRTSSRIVLGALVMFSVTDVAWSDTLTIPELNALEPQWSPMATLKARHTIVGRYSSYGGDLLRMQQTELGFRAAEGRALPRVINRSGNLQAEGYFDRYRGRVTFMVEQLQETDSDVAALRDQERELLRGEPELLYNAVRRALSLAEFYADDDLRRAATTLLNRAIQRDRSQLKRDDDQGLRQLADRAGELKLPDALRAELMFESFLIRYRRLRANTPSSADLTALADEVAQTLPGSATPLRAEQFELNGSFNQSADRTYAQGNDDVRRALHRVLYTSLRLALYEFDPRAGNERHGFELAAAIERELPDRPEAADELRQKALEWNQQHVSELDRSQLRDLIDYYKSRGEERKARQIVVARVSNVQSQGAGGLMQAARDYVELLGDSDEAVRLYKQAWEQLARQGYADSPDAQTIVGELKRMGWYRTGDEWITRKQKDALAVAKVAQGMADENDEYVGKTAPEIRKAIGRPTRVTRQLSARKIVEIWIYQDQDFALYLSRARRDAADDAQVVGRFELAR